MDVSETPLKGRTAGAGTALLLTVDMIFIIFFYFELLYRDIGRTGYFVSSTVYLIMCMVTAAAGVLLYCRRGRFTELIMLFVLGLSMYTVLSCGRQVYEDLFLVLTVSAAAVIIYSAAAWWKRRSSPECIRELPGVIWKGASVVITCAAVVFLILMGAQRQMFLEKDCMDRIGSPVSVSRGELGMEHGSWNPDGFAEGTWEDLSEEKRCELLQEAADMQNFGEFNMYFTLPLVVDRTGPEEEEDIRFDERRGHIVISEEELGNDDGYEVLEGVSAAVFDAYQNESLLLYRTSEYSANRILSGNAGMCYENLYKGEDFRTYSGMNKVEYAESVVVICRRDKEDDDDE